MPFRQVEKDRVNPRKVEKKRLHARKVDKGREEKVHACER
jgi:hypothetical protein